MLVNRAFCRPLDGDADSWEGDLISWVGVNSYKNQLLLPPGWRHLKRSTCHQGAGWSPWVMLSHQGLVYNLFGWKSGIHSGSGQINLHKKKLVLLGQMYSLDLCYSGIQGTIEEALGWPRREAGCYSHKVDILHGRCSLVRINMRPKNLTTVPTPMGSYVLPFGSLY